MITAKEIKVLDRNAEFFDVPSETLMEQAGKGVADFIKTKFTDKNLRIIVFCGPGNNGGDGFVAARHLSDTYEVYVFLTRSPIQTKVAQMNFQKIQDKGLLISKNSEQIDYLLSKSDIIVDAMLGIGLSGELREPFNNIVNKINTAKKKKVISVDVPTGLGTSLSVQPHYTLCFHDQKSEMNKGNSGEIHIVDIGIPKEAETYVGPGELTVYYPRSKKDSHKGENGSVLIIGGGPYIGAPALAGLAALRTGSDLVFIATPQRSWNAIASFSPNLIVEDLKADYLTTDDLLKIQRLLKQCTAVVIGPGLGISKETKRAVLKLIKIILAEHKPLVIDADALEPLSNHLQMIANSQTVLTPHRGEFKKLTNINLSDSIKNNMESISQLAQQFGVTIFLKGPVDIISNGVQTKLNNVHNEAMTVGGTGDVLAGIIGGLLSKNVQPYNAARAAAFLNGYAGNKAFQNKSYGLLATDIIEELPHVLKTFL
jgi:NAD(P)H-hydrate epimerase